MKRWRNVILGGLLVAMIVALAVGQAVVQAAGSAQAVMAPKFEVDPLWPKPLPNHWLMGNVIGVGLDANDHVFIVHRQDTSIPPEEGLQDKIAECCAAAPPVIEFDPAGNMVAAWGGAPADSSYVWPASNHGINVDNQNNVWIGGNGGGDSHALVFTHDGKYIRTIGKPHQAVNSTDTTHFGQIADIAFDFKTNEAFFADGYGNRRVAVVDITTGRVKRIWGAYGRPPSDSNVPANSNVITANPNFRTPVHCAEPSNDGFLYVCDRGTRRIQVFREDGTFVKEMFIYPKTGGDGSTWDIAFSREAGGGQKYMYLADGQNENVYVFDRLSLTILYKFGNGGRMAGQWYQAHSIATDTKGNIYTTETYEGRRVQKFTYKGISAVTNTDIRTPWPVSTATPAAAPAAAARPAGTP